MIPFKDNSILKQYIPSKPHKHGYKLFVLRSNKGLIHYFHLYTGKIKPPADEPDLGACSNIMVRLAKVVPVQKKKNVYHSLITGLLLYLCSAILQNRSYLPENSKEQQATR